MTTTVRRIPALSTELAKTDDFIPFASESQAPAASTQDIAPRDGRKHYVSDTVAEDGWRKEDDWHAEISVTAPVDGGKLNEDVEIDWADMREAEAPAPHQQETLNDALAFEASDMPQEKRRRKRTLDGASRPERLERRARRLAEGKLKLKPRGAARRSSDAVTSPASTATTESATAESVTTESVAMDFATTDSPVADRQTSVLGIIEKMEGPRIAKTPGPVADSPQARAQSVKDKTAHFKTAQKPVAQPDRPKPKREAWQVQKAALTAKFGDQSWSPRKRLSPDTLDGIRALHASDPTTYSTETLSSQFAVSPENIRRILRSKWRPNDEEKEDRALRWQKRGVKKWSAMAETGARPPARWREMGVGSVAGMPEEKPAWKPGGRRREGGDVAWLQDGEDRLSGRIV